MATNNHNPVSRDPVLSYGLCIDVVCKHTYRQNNQRESKRWGEGEREKETDRWVGGQANRQTGRLTDKTDRYR